MHIKNQFIRKLFKAAIIIAVFECVYLYALPPVINHFVSYDFIKEYIKNNTNAALEYEKLKIKTNITPDITLSAQNISIKDKENTYTFLNSDNLNVKLSVLDLLRKKINIKNISSDNVDLYAFQTQDGNFNFEELFPQKEKSDFSLKLKNNKIDFKKYNFIFEDKILNESITFTGEPLIAEIKNKKKLSVKTKGQTISADKTSDIDIDLSTTLAFSKKITPDIIDGKCFLYDINLDVFEPYIKKFIDKNTKELSGYIEYLQISSNKDNGKKIVSVNSMLDNIVYDRVEWDRNVHLNGKGKINTSFVPLKNEIDIKSTQILSDTLDAKIYGDFNLKKEKPYLNLDIQAVNSRAEDIFGILPENVGKETETIKKVKYYGIYGDVNGRVNIKGSFPEPEVTGHVRGENLHALDKSIHHLHKGTVDLTFDKRILNMDILVELFDNQSAKIYGHTYLFRDGVNNVTIKTTDRIDFPLAQKIIIPVSKVFNFMLGPIVDMDIKSGKGIIDLNVQGSMDFVKMNGYSSFRNASLTYNGLYGLLHDGMGRLDFKDDVISFDTQQAYVKSNPFHIDGFVKLNDNMEYNIRTRHTEAKDALEVINNSTLLKDVKAGLAIFTEVGGPLNLDVNVKAKIVPVPFGQPPLPVEEAFEDMRVKGSVELLGNTGHIIGFKVPLEQVKGKVDFTQTEVDILPLSAICGTSPLTIYGKIINDFKTRIPDVDVTVTSKSVNLKDTVKFLTESYLYPDSYPDISSLYNIASKHDLYFRYKAKSLDFLTKNAYAQMNFIPDETNNPIKAKSGRIVMDKAVVSVDNIAADFFDSELSINGDVKNIDTVNPSYNLDIKTNNFNLENLNDTSKITILPKQMENALALFKDYKGFADLDIALRKNVLTGKIDLKSPEFKLKSSNLPFKFEDFPIIFKKDVVTLENVAASIADMPFFGNISVANYYSKPDINAYITSKLTNNFVKKYLKPEFADKLEFKGDINLSSGITGTPDNLNIKPKLTMYPESDIIFEGVNVGDINDKRSFEGDINLRNNIITIKNLDYIKYVSSQNNKIYPMKFMSITGVLKNVENKIIPLDVSLKTFKNIPARFLNVLFKTPILKQGAFNGEIRIAEDEKTQIPKISGEVNFGNINIPLYDTVIKHIKIDTDNEDINISLFGFLFDEKVTAKAKIINNFSEKLQIKSLNISADKIDKDKILEIISNAHSSMNTNNQQNSMDLGALSLKEGHIEIKELTIKDFVANNFNTDFSIDDSGVFEADNLKADIEQGTVKGTIIYDINNTDFTGDFELIDVDSNYVAETLFEAKDQVYGNANGRIYIKTKGTTDKERIKNLSGFVFFDIDDGNMPKLGSLEYLLRAGNILKSGITGFTINSVLELLHLVKTGYFSNINGSCTIEDGVAKDIEIFSKGENMSLYIQGEYDIANTEAKMEVLGKLSKHISTVFGTVGNISLNTFFKLIPGISLFDFGRDNFIEDVEKIPSFTNGDYDARIFQAMIDGNINGSKYVQSFKWVK